MVKKYEYKVLGDLLGQAARELKGKQFTFFYEKLRERLPRLIATVYKQAKKQSAE